MDLCRVIKKTVGTDVFTVLQAGDDKSVKRLFFATVHP
jgi:hypothetical protein